MLKAKWNRLLVRSLLPLLATSAAKLPALAEGTGLTAVPEPQKSPGTFELPDLSELKPQESSPAIPLNFPPPLSFSNLKSDSLARGAFSPFELAAPSAVPFAMPASSTLPVTASSEPRMTMELSSPIEVPPGLLSMADLADIDGRILRRIAAGGHVRADGTEISEYRVLSIAPGDFLHFDQNTLSNVVGTTQWLAEFPGMDSWTVARGEMIALQEDEASTRSDDPSALIDPASSFVSAASYVDSQGAGGGGGTGSAAFVANTPSFTIARPVHMPSAIPLSLALPASGGPNRAAPRATAAAVSVATPSAAATPPQLGLFPRAILGYHIADMQPVPSSWTASQAFRLSWGRLGGFVGDTAGNNHAAIWNVSATGFIDMHPSNGPVASLFPFNTRINDLRGTQAVGIGSNTRTVHALLWTNANPLSVIDLNPAGFGSSYAQATTGSQQIGYGYLATNADQPHALLWNGSATNFFDLNPPNYLFSFAFAGDSVHQVGYGEDMQFNLNALVWSGSAASAVSIHPSSGAFFDSRAISLNGNRAGGYGTSTNGYSHAIIWTALNPGSGVDVNPAEFFDSQITAINPYAAVGYGRTHADITGSTHALLWNADGSGYIDLSTYLPARYTASEADGIDINGNVVGFAYDSLTANVHAVEWLAVVPEPTTLLSVGGLFALSLVRTRRAKPSCRA